MLYVMVQRKKTDTRNKNVRILRFVMGLSLVVLLAVSSVAQNAPATDTAKAPESAKAVIGSPNGVQLDTSLVLSLSSTNLQRLKEILAHSAKEMAPTKSNENIARLATLILQNQHFRQKGLDDSLSARFLDRYLEELDNLHLHFLESDIQEFMRYRTLLDDMTQRGNISPAYRIFSRFLERVEQRVAYVGELLETEKFEFTNDDRYNLDRRKAPRPKNLDEAKQLWRQHLRYEILQEKLNKEKPEEIGTKLVRRYERLLRTLKDYDSDDVFEFYLSSLAHAFDPHSDYMGKSSYESFNIGMKLSLFGIGALLQSEDGYCKIKSLVPNGPAAKSKQIKEGDRIVAVAQGDHEPVDVIEMKLSKVVDMIRGQKDTEVRLTVIPADAPDPSARKVVSLVRDEVKLEDQEAKARIYEVPGENNKSWKLGLIDLPSFYADFEKRTEGRKSTTRDVEILVRKLKQENVDGIILDLRRNGGGSLEEAINLTGLFIKQGPVVQVKDADGELTVDNDVNPSVLYDGPLIVMTSRFSASASEILAGALQDYGRALIVGDSSTHGKGTVQSVLQLDKIAPSFGSLPVNPGALKITIRKFYRANGMSTQLNGVTPDIILPSVNNIADVGEKALENHLPFDTIPSAKFEKLNRIQPILSELQRRSAQRIDTDKDFQYIKEDLEQYRKAMEDRSVSLNEATRLKEKEEAELRSKARIAEIKTRPEQNEKAYEITLQNATLAGLPAPVAKTNSLAAAESPKPVDAEDDEEDHAKIAPIDVALKETKRILMDLAELLGGDKPAVAAAKSTASKGTSDLSGNSEPSKQ